MSQLKIDFGKYLQTLRLVAVITREVLANEIGVAAESISNIEWDVYETNFDNLEKLTMVLEIQGWRYLISCRLHCARNSRSRVVGLSRAS